MTTRSITNRGIGVAASCRIGCATAIAAVFVLVVALSAQASANTDGQAQDRAALSQRLAVQFVSGTTTAERLAARQRVDATYEQRLAAPAMQQLALPEGASADAAAMALRADPHVSLVAVEGHFRADADPAPFWDDPLLAQQWSLHNYGQVFLTELTPQGAVDLQGTPGADIDAVGAWTSAANDGAPIGVIDTGVAYGHEDLSSVLFANDTEQNGVDGVDDDNNGLVDDLHGWDFYGDDNDPRDRHGHGTHVASIAAAATGNAAGISGVSAWGKVLPLRAADDTGLFSWVAIREAVTYGLERGVRIFNGSFGGSAMDPAFDAIIQANPDALFVFSAGNGGADNVGDDHDAAGGANKRYPCDAAHDNVICVAATDWNDELASFSDYGVNSVDLAAPGSRIYAAKPCLHIASEAECPPVGPGGGDPVGRDGGPGAYQLLSGTSMAAPIVAGAASLIWGSYPAIHSSQLKSVLVNAADQLPDLSAKLAYGARLDLARSLEAAAQIATPEVDWPVPPPQPPPPGPDGQGGEPPGGIFSAPPPPAADSADRAPEKLSYRVLRSRYARLGRSRYLRFKLRCSAICSASVSLRPKIKGQKPFRKTIRRRGGGTRSFRVKIPTSRLKVLRRSLRDGRRVKVRVVVNVRDANRRRTRATAFTLYLKR